MAFAINGVFIWLGKTQKCIDPLRSTRAGLCNHIAEEELALASSYNCLILEEAANESNS